MIKWHHQLCTMYNKNVDIILIYRCLFCYFLLSIPSDKTNLPKACLITIFLNWFDISLYEMMTQLLYAQLLLQDDTLKQQMNSFLLSTQSQNEIASLDNKVVYIDCAFFCLCGMMGVYRMCFLLFMWDDGCI